MLPDYNEKLKNIKKQCDIQIKQLHTANKVYDKIKPLLQTSEHPHNLSYHYYYFDNSFDLYHVMPKNITQSVSYHANLIFEPIDEVLNLTDLKTIPPTNMQVYVIKGFYSILQVNLHINLHDSAKCTITYEPTTLQLPVITCGE